MDVLREHMFRSLVSSVVVCFATAAEIQSSYESDGANQTSYGHVAIALWRLTNTSLLNPAGDAQAQELGPLA